MGSIKIVDGTQGAGKLLVSDENGVTSWQEIVGGTFITAKLNENITFTTSGTGYVLLTGNSLKLSNTTIVSTATSSKTISLPDASGIVVITSDGNINNITTSQIQDNAITSEKIADATIVSSDIVDSAISPSKLAGNPGNGVTGTTLISNGDGTFSWGGFVKNQDNSVTVDSGNVGIGTNSPTEKLEVVGTIKIFDGTQGENKVLASDSNGLASWQEASVLTKTSLTAESNENITFTTSGTGKVLIIGDSLSISNTTFVNTATSSKTISLPDASGTLLLTSDGSIGDITSSQLADNAITSAKIVDAAISYTKISDATITPSKLAGNPGNGVTGTTLLSNGDGTVSWGGFVYTQGAPTSTISVETGNVGIDTSAPTEKLEVIGNVKIDSILQLTPRTTAPDNPSAGLIYFNSTDSKLKVYTGAAWQDIN